MISEDKMSHILHLMFDGIEKAALVEFVRKEEAIRESRKVCNNYLTELGTVGDLAIQRIRSQKNAPKEGTPQWEVLYGKYLEEELRKKGG